MDSVKELKMDYVFLNTNRILLKHSLDSIHDAYFNLKIKWTKVYVNLYVLRITLHGHKTNKYTE